MKRTHHEFSSIFIFKVALHCYAQNTPRSYGNNAQQQECVRWRASACATDQARLPDGKVAVREYIRHPGAVVIIPLLDNGELVLERQYRYPLQREFYELPAGKIDGGEDPLRCAQRELLEETGYTAESWRYIATLHPCIGYSDEKLIYYFAEKPYLQGRKPG